MSVPTVTGRVAFLDAPAGIAGDMLLGALVDAGLPLDVLEGVVSGLGLQGVTLRATRVRRGALAATKLDVVVHGQQEGPDGEHAHEHGHAHGHAHEHELEHGHAHTHAASATGDTARLHLHAPEHGHGVQHGHRPYREIVELLARADGIAPAPLAQARRVFRALAEAEARVHGVSLEEVVFHEVGALDALVDIVGACVGLHALGVSEVRVGALPWAAGGSVGTAHGRLPLPAPAVALLLVGQPTFPSGETFEQVTPTGAALARALSQGAAVPLGFVPRVVGLGAGARDQGRLPNVLRLVLGDTGPGAETLDALLLETNLDDVTGQALARAIERALAEGALDAWAVPATMKKGRPGHVLAVLARPEDAARLERVLFEETPTLGVRRQAVARTTLERHHVDVATPFGPVRLKVRAGPRGPEATPEHDDCKRLADAQGVPLRTVQEAALRAWRGA